MKSAKAVAEALFTHKKVAIASVNPLLVSTDPIVGFQQQFRDFWHFGFQRGVIVANSDQLGLPA